MKNQNIKIILPIFLMAVLVICMLAETLPNIFSKKIVSTENDADMVLQQSQYESVSQPPTDAATPAQTQPPTKTPTFAQTQPPTETPAPAETSASENLQSVSAINEIEVPEEYIIYVLLPLAFQKGLAECGADVDINADYDGDGLTNAQEYFYDTLPGNVDSDGDGLDDYTEIFVNHTNPMLYEKHAEVPQAVSFSRNGFTVCVSFEGEEEYRRRTTITSHTYETMYDDIEFLLSPVFNIEFYGPKDYQNARITFDLPPGFPESHNPEDLSIICFEETTLSAPKTSYDPVKKQLYADIDSWGRFGVISISKFIDSMQ